MMKYLLFYRLVQLTFLCFISLLFSNLYAQNGRPNSTTETTSKLQFSLLKLKNDLKQLDNLEFNNGLSLNKHYSNKWGSVKINLDSIDYNYKPWESEKHFWIGAGEIALLEFLPWALARWIRSWENPEDNWAKVTPDTWWQNISYGWEYDGDNFTTNNFAHPYHGALFFNAGRSNGYDFWESTAWSLTGSAIWEYFGETFRPSFNDWIYTGVGGANLGEIIYRLSSMVTDNRASGSDRVWSEIFGTIINPVRGFNRAISGEMGQNFDNPEWSRPDNFLISFNAGTRSLDKDNDDTYEDKEVEGLFEFELVYGNYFKAKKPFDFFNFNFALASGLPHFTNMNSSGYLFGFELEKKKHNLNFHLDFNYNNLIKEEYTETDTLYSGFLFGTTQIYPHLLSRFPIGTETNIVTQIGINGIMMGATPDDYYVDVEGRVYDLGPGVGTRIVAAIQNGIWNYVSFLYYGAWIWTQSEPSDSKHHIHFLRLDAQYPLTEYFSIGISAGVYWRNSYYENFPNINQNVPIGRLYFRTAIIDI